MTTTDAPQTYAEHVADYALAGWPCVLPVPADAKFPPPVGFTGAEGRDTDALTLVDLATRYPAHAIAIRLPVGVVGIDVDQYEKKGKQKHGAATLAALEARLGPLPPTWSSTARGSDAGPGPSRVMLFRVPAGRYRTMLQAEHAGPAGEVRVTRDIEILQHHHRYAVVWPSLHSDTGTPYRWYDPEGRPAERVPAPAELAELPPAWLEHLREGATEQAAASADVNAGQALLDQLLDDHRPECAEITSARLTAAAELTKADEGSRHDTMTARVHHLVQLAASGHAGVGRAFLELREAWARLTAGEDRADELERALLTSARKAVTSHGPVQVVVDPCLLVAGGVPLPTGPEAARVRSVVDGTEVEESVQIVEPPRWASIRMAIGTEAFDPNADMDQTLAEAVLARVYPALRYAYDTNDWLLRLPDRWEVQGRMSRWAVSEVARLMPIGDPTAEKGSDQHARSARRARLMQANGAGAVAAKMDDLVTGGVHPATVALADLDADPEVLWAGGVPWSLRFSDVVPMPAEHVNPDLPHLHAAGVRPEPRETPLWDAFLAAVWPDPELRAWALRVLSISLTGYADRALPVLLGETGRGKTQVAALIMSVLGSYAHAANPKLLKDANEHDTIVFDLKGRRLSFIDEAPSDKKSGQERLKQLTGGGALTGRQMNQNPITFAPTHTLVLTANDAPTLTDPAVRSRVRLIPCEGDPEAIRAARAAIGPFAGATWRREAPGVLAALMTEAAAWLADPTSAAVTAAPENVRYRAEHLGAEQDPVAAWVREETEHHEPGTLVRELHQAFRASCRRNGIRDDQIPDPAKFGTLLTRLGIGVTHTKRGNLRHLRVLSGGFLPGMEPVKAPTTVTLHPEPPVARVGAEEQPQARQGEGTTPSGEGQVNTFRAEPSPAYPQVNPSVSVNGEGGEGSKNPYTHAPAHAHVNGDLGNPPDPSPDPSGEQTAAPRKPKRERSAEATRRAAEAKAEKRAAAIAEAAGGAFELPALVTRNASHDGSHATGSISVTKIGRLENIPPTLELDALTVDVETTGYPIGHANYALRTVQLGCGAYAVVLDPSDPDQAEVVRTALAGAKVLHAHSATADLAPLAYAGLCDYDEAFARMEDTVTLAKLADPASTGSDPGLKKTAAAMLGDLATSPAADDARAALFKAGKWLTEVKVTTPVERSGWAQVDPRCETMIRYAASDVLDDAAIATRLPRPAPAVLEREQVAAAMTARVAFRGIRVDGAHVAELLAEHTGKRADAAQQVRGLAAAAGVMIDNPGSNPQVGAALAGLGAPLPRTATGKPSVAEGVLEPLSRDETDAGRLAKAVLTYRHHDTAIGTFLEPYDQLVRYGDGRARPTVYTLEARSGRMSCVRPNLQQVPREGGFRACLTADPGELLVSADFSGVELRVAAALSQDENLKAILADPERDLHWEVARLAFGPQATKANRYAVKRGVFGRIYGGGVAAIARGVGVSDATARLIIDAMDHLTPGLTEWSRQVAGAVEAGRTQFRTYSGRVVHMPKDRPYAAPNYCIQGTARELLIDALMRWRETRWGDAVLLPVHDELVVRVPEDQAAEATAALEAAMTSELAGVAIVAEASEPSFSWKDSV